jgi:tetratricopeptide (TPR) repeat protein
MARATRTRAENWNAAALCALLALATLAAYGSFAGFEFLNWDDNFYVTGNSHVQAGLSFESVRWALTATDAHNWHPLTWLSHMLDVELFGLAPVWHHRVSLCLHVLSTLLLFLAFFRMTGAAGRSAFVAGLFALHPLHVESVAWIAERKDVLSALCFVGALLLYARYAERPSTLRYLWVALVLAAGLAAKPMLVTLPAVLLLLDVWPLRRLRLAPALDRRRLAALALEKLPLVGLCAASSVITLIAQQQAIALAARYTLADRLGNALVSYVRYLAGAVFPSQLSVTYTHPDSWAPSVLFGCGVSLALITAAALRTLSTRPWLAVGWLWFLGMLVPVIGVIQVGEQALADRYSYLPSIGLFVIAAWGIPPLIPEVPGRARALAFAAIAVLAVCGLLTRAQVEHWRNSNALWEHARAVDPQNPLALEVLGVLAEQQGHQVEALGLYRRAIEIDPRRQNSQYNLGHLLLWYGRPAEALGPLREALKIRPDFAVAYEALGHAYRALGEESLSLGAFERSVELAPGVPNAQYGLGIALLRSGQPRQALIAFDQALRLQPDFASAFVGQSEALAALGDRAAALVAGERALQLVRRQGDLESAQQIEKQLEQLRDASTH